MISLIWYFTDVCEQIWRNFSVYCDAAQKRLEVPFKDPIVICPGRDMYGVKKTRLANMSIWINVMGTP